MNPEVVEDYAIANTENVLSVLNGGMEITSYHNCRGWREVLAADLARRGSVVFLLSALSTSIQSLLARYQELTSFFQMSVDAFFLPHDYAQWRERGRENEVSEIGWYLVQRYMAEIVMYLSTNDFAAAMDTTRLSIRFAPFVPFRFSWKPSPPHASSLRWVRVRRLTLRVRGTRWSGCWWAWGVWWLLWCCHCEGSEVA